MGAPGTPGSLETGGRRTAGQDGTRPLAGVPAFVQYHDAVHDYVKLSGA